LTPHPTAHIFRPWATLNPKEYRVRLFAITLVIFIGALMACVSALVEALPGYRHSNSLEGCGLVLAAAGLLLFVIEWWSTPVRRDKTE